MRITYRRALSYSAEQWREFDGWSIDPLDAEQMNLVAGILCTSTNRVLAAVKAVGRRAGDIRRHLNQKGVHDA